MKLKNGIHNVIYKVIPPVEDSLYIHEFHSNYHETFGILRFRFVIQQSIRITFAELLFEFNHPPMTSVDIEL